MSDYLHTKEVYEMFGFKLIRTKKRDLEDLEVFKSTVRQLDEYIKQLYMVIDRQKLIDLQGIQMGFNLIEYIKVDSSIYAENRFSTPLQTFCIFDVIKEISRTYSELISVTLSVVERCGSAPSEEALHDDEELHSLFRIIMIKKSSCLNAIRKLIHTMLYDNERINLGVNIINDYYKHRNIKPPEANPDDITFTIRFANQHNDKSKTKINAKEN